VEAAAGVALLSQPCHITVLGVDLAVSREGKTPVADLVAACPQLQHNWCAMSESGRCCGQLPGLSDEVLLGDLCLAQTLFAHCGGSVRDRSAC
jgi:hypothetical protein